jgi:hypothetical protein
MSEASIISQQGRERLRGNGRGVGRGIGTEVERLPWKVPVSEELTEREELLSRSHVVGSASTAGCIPFGGHGDLFSAQASPPKTLGVVRGLLNNHQK